MTKLPNHSPYARREATITARQRHLRALHCSRAQHHISLSLYCIILTAYCLLCFAQLPVYGYDIINTYPHDTTAFTQGLIFKNGFLYESTGLYGGSSLRKVELETGNTLMIRYLSSQYFAEGMTAYKDTFFQLTWLNHLGFVYIEQDSFELIDEFTYPTQGWGLTHAGTYLIMSDGSPDLYFLDPHSYAIIDQIEVHAEGVLIWDLNELEYIQGKIYANVWYSDSIAIIDPQTGDVLAWLNLNGLLGSEELDRPPDVLNGIAFDPENVRLFVTGKLWPNVFEIDVIPLNYPPTIIYSSPASPCSISIDSTLILSVNAQDPDPEDTLQYIWSINGVTDHSAHDSIYYYNSDIATIDTVKVKVTDQMFSDSCSWIIFVGNIGIMTDNTLLPEIFPSLQSLSNPFKELTFIRFAVPKKAHVSLKIFDVCGRIVETLINEEKKIGNYEIPFNAKELKPGIYFAQLWCNEYNLTEKLIKLR